MVKVIVDGLNKRVKCPSCTSLLEFSTEDVRRKNDPPCGAWDDDYDRDMFYIVCTCGRYVNVTNLATPLMKSSAKEREKFSDDM
jgi:hypothetical protein